jgi:arylsulfatase A-like enzyme
MASRDPQRPNVLFLLTDDQGYWALGCAGNDEIRTPNLDRLGAQGTRLANFFCASPVCSPARASVLTGRIPSQHGVHDFLHWGKTVPEASRVEETAFLAGQPTYTELLAGAGYHCAISGKWHLGYSMEPQAGFAQWRVLPSGGCGYFEPALVEDGRLVSHAGSYASDLFTDNALSMLGGQLASDTPFCMHVHYTAPHSPWERKHHPEELWDDYFNNCPFESVPDPGRAHPDSSNTDFFQSPGKRRAKLAGYYAAVTAMDANVGRLLDWLEENDLRQSTLVVFMSDNGMNMGHHGICGKGNGTWPQNMYETSVKVPALVSQPGRVAQGAVDDHLLSQYDWLPTALDYLGVDVEVPEGLPGRSFAPLLRGESLDEDREVVVMDEYGPVRMIRTREWKLVCRYPAGRHELYHVAVDPFEQTNLHDVRGHSEIVSELRGRLENWFGRYVDPRIDGAKLPVTGRGQTGPADAPDAFRSQFPETWLPEEPR